MRALLILGFLAVCCGGEVGNDLVSPPSSGGSYAAGGTAGYSGGAGSGGLGDVDPGLLWQGENSTSLPHIDSMNVTLLGQVDTDASSPSYNYTCVGTGYTGTGPTCDTLTSETNEDNCPWNAPNPRIWLEVNFVNWAPCSPPPAEYFDLAQANSELVQYCVLLNLAYQPQLDPFNSPYRFYLSSIGSENCSMSAPNGYSHNSSASGTVVISPTGIYYDCNTGYTKSLPQAPASDKPNAMCCWGEQVYKIQLFDVALPSSVDQSNGMYPANAKVSATIYWLH